MTKHRYRPVDAQATSQCPSCGSPPGSCSSRLSPVGSRQGVRRGATCTSSRSLRHWQRRSSSSSSPSSMTFGGSAFLLSARSCSPWAPRSRSCTPRARSWSPRSSQSGSSSMCWRRSSAVVRSPSEQRLPASTSCAIVPRSARQNVATDHPSMGGSPREFPRLNASTRWRTGSMRLCSRYGRSPSSLVRSGPKPPGVATGVGILKRRGRSSRGSSTRATSTRAQRQVGAVARLPSSALLATSPS